MITSFTRGRIRLRLIHLRGAELPEIPKESLKGVTNLSINPQTGSALLEFDPEILDLETIASFLDSLDPQAAEVLRNPHLLKPRTIFGSPIPKLEDCPPPPKEAETVDPAPKRIRGSAKATTELINLGTAFIGTALSGFFSSRKFHVQCGAFLGLMFIGHVWKYRKRLRPLHQMTLAEILDLPQFPKFGSVPPSQEPAETESEELELEDQLALEESKNAKKH
ncbi:MAG: hypothetical protein LBT47_02150 [Deltaproteobacteria bacterium]|jgi:hypothetical protein|nr:hypothetical protein [Deltaproteobacteria bacterium]